MGSNATQATPFSCEEKLSSFEKDDLKRVMQALGPMPREVLIAMVDYGLSDSDISRYYRLSRDTITPLRRFYGVAGDRQTG